MIKVIKVLVIEDDPKMRAGLIEVLTDMGYEADSAANGELGLAKIMKQDYDVVMTDLIMPVVGGMEVLQETKRLKPKTHVIVITAFATIENAVEAMKVGASEYISKPFKIDEIQTKIRLVLEKARIEEYPLFESNVIKAISNPIRINVVKLLDKEVKLKFTEIKNILKIDDATKLSFHLRVLKQHNIIEQDSVKIYMLTPAGKKLIKNLKQVG